MSASSAGGISASSASLASSSASASHSTLMARELVERLFPNLEEVLAWHSKANQKMKERMRGDGFPVGDIADILSEMVSILTTVSLAGKSRGEILRGKKGSGKSIKIRKEGGEGKSLRARGRALEGGEPNIRKERRKRRRAERGRIEGGDAAYSSSWSQRGFCPRPP